MNETAALRLNRSQGLGGRRNRGRPPAEMIAVGKKEKNTHTQTCNVTICGDTGKGSMTSTAPVPPGTSQEELKVLFSTVVERCH